jgi:hypothetical protein
LGRVVGPESSNVGIGLPRDHLDLGSRVFANRGYHGGNTAQNLHW